jgi:hypothetical protein
LHCASLDGYALLQFFDHLKLKIGAILSRNGGENNLEFGVPRLRPSFNLAGRWDRGREGTRESDS